MSKRRLSKIVKLHYFKLVFRSLLFLAAAGLYVFHRIKGSAYPFDAIGRQPAILGIIWLVFVVEMFLRFFPSSMESMGCQKQFARNYMPRFEETVRPVIQPWQATFAVAAAWFALNGVIGALYLLGVFDAGIMLLISLAYSVCDMICILFFCPFQTWFMKNKCCGSCRIYNWDYAMMFTPLVFVPHVYTWSLLGLALLLLAFWELAVRRHPERFSETTNCALSCEHCPEKLCHHKTQLRHFLRENKHLLKIASVAAAEYERLKRRKSS